MTEYKEPNEGNEAPRKDLLGSARQFVNGVLSPLKGRDLSQTVEDFTSEMTLVAEGLSEDQRRLEEAADRLSARQTELEETLLQRLEAAEAEISELQSRVKAQEGRAAKAEKAASAKEKKREGLQGVLRQATVLAAILAGAWVLVTLINFFKP